MFKKIISWLIFLWGELAIKKRFYCPICCREYKSFRPYGVQIRLNAQCPGCGSLERHRLLWVALEKKSLLPENTSMRMLHVAPEACLATSFKNLYEYISIDLNSPIAMMQMDITCLEFPDEYFDAIVCNHVLEHVPDDNKALSELYRVLKIGGWASIQVPIERETTYEENNITDPIERELKFGQHDHIRAYGIDFIDRLEQVGFSVNILPMEDLLDKDLRHRISVDCEKSVWISTKS